MKAKRSLMKPARPFESFRFEKRTPGETMTVWVCVTESLQNKLLVTEHHVTMFGAPAGTFTAEWKGTPSFEYLDRFYFASKADAATVVYHMLELHKTAVAKVPIPVHIHERLTHNLRDLQRQEQELRSICFNNRIQQEDLVRLAHELGDNLEHGELPLTHAQQAIKEIDELCLEGEEVPFFSETKLYKLLGKEDARSVLAVLHNLKRIADPVRGE